MSFIADNIMQDYEKKKRFQANKRRRQLEYFKRKNCVNCKNKNTNLCTISITIDGNLKCVFKEEY